MFQVKAVFMTDQILESQVLLFDLSFGINTRRFCAASYDTLDRARNMEVISCSLFARIVEQHSHTK